MKTLFLIILISTISCSYSQTYVPFKVKMAETPLANPKPLLKVYGNTDDNDRQPTYYQETPPPTPSYEREETLVPKAETYRITGYKVTTYGEEAVSLMIELTTDNFGKEKLRVTQHKAANSEYWQKLTFPAEAHSNKGSGSMQNYNYKSTLTIGEVYFNF